jgi:uncharacterized RDD family membrane protein YckC
MKEYSRPAIILNTLWLGVVILLVGVGVSYTLGGWINLLEGRQPPSQGSGGTNLVYLFIMILTGAAALGAAGLALRILGALLIRWLIGATEPGGGSEHGISAPLRLLGAILDIGLAGYVLPAVVVTAVESAYGALGGEGSLRAYMLEGGLRSEYLVLISGLLYVVYEMILVHTGRRPATLGHLVAGVTVVDEATDAPAHPARVFVRATAKAVFVFSGIGLPLLLLGAITPERRGIHEFLAGTKLLPYSVAVQSTGRSAKLPGMSGAPEHGGLKV